MWLKSLGLNGKTVEEIASMLHCALQNKICKRKKIADGVCFGFGASTTVC